MNDVIMTETELTALAQSEGWTNTYEFETLTLDEQDGKTLISGCAERVSELQGITIVYHELFDFTADNPNSLNNVPAPDNTWKVFGAKVVCDETGEELSYKEIGAALPKTSDFDFIDYSQLDMTSAYNLGESTEAQGGQNESHEKAPKSYNVAVKDYLEALRESGVTNMLTAPAYLESMFGMTQKEASACFRYWAAK